MVAQEVRAEFGALLYYKTDIPQALIGNGHLACLAFFLYWNL